MRFSSRYDEGYPFVVFVFLYMWFNTASLFIAGIGMLQVVFSVGPALILWYLVDGGKGVQFLQFLTMFMILGIGADDVFVFVDAWNQNKRKVDPNQEDSRLICFILTIREAFPQCWLQLQQQLLHSSWVCSIQYRAFHPFVFLHVLLLCLILFGASR